jgi:hypothetical protein
MVGEYAETVVTKLWDADPQGGYAKGSPNSQSFAVSLNSPVSAWVSLIPTEIN